jgi:glycosyltransferase involved in cell wall biosynthesis
MKKRILIISNIPSFYKINLYNELSEKSLLSTIFLNSDRIKRRADFSSSSDKFLIHTLVSPKFPRFIYWLLKYLSYDEVILGGWDRLHYWAVLLMPFKKIALSVESSIYDIGTESSFKKTLKKIFLSRISRVYVSGLPHKQLLESLGFKRDIIVTKGVGIINYPIGIRSSELPNIPSKFLFVGRVEKIKGIDYLIDAFKQLPDCTLSIVGEGDAVEMVKNSSSNVHYLGYMPNEKLISIYQSHDMFILPSLIEPWGLVVEEAIANKIPVMVSDKVGCSIDLVSDLGLGIIFKARDVEAIVTAINALRTGNKYGLLKTNVSNYSIMEKDILQVDAYLT